MKKIYQRVFAFILTFCMMTSSVGDVGLFADAAFSVLKLSKTLKCGDGRSYEITVRYDADSGIPQDAELSVEELAEDGDTRRAEYVDQSMQLVGVSPEKLDFARAFDISLLDPATGEEIQPDGSVQVSVRLLDVAADRSDAISVVHFDGADAETVEASVRGRDVEFRTDGFSVYVLCGYTVDFHWDGYTYSIAGETEITLGALLSELGVTEIGLADVAAVSFSNPAYLRIERLGSDWLLCSLAPFYTEETLTLTLGSGKSVEIRVTDASTVSTPQELIDAVKPGSISAEETITLMDDIELTDSLDITFWNPGAEFTIDLGGNTLKIPGDLKFQSTGTMTLKNGTLDANINVYNGTSAVRLSSGLTVTGDVTAATCSLEISGGTISGNVSVSGASSLTMTDGTIGGNVSVSGGSSLTITDGTITGSVTTTEGGAQTISGGTFAGNLDITYGTTEISGGTFNGAVNMTYNSGSVTGGNFYDEVTVTGDGMTITSGSFTQPPTVNGTPVVLADVLPAPIEALSYNGTAQALVTAGSTSRGILLYSLDGTAYSTEVPTAVNAGVYTVYYQIEGDDHSVVASDSVQTTLAAVDVTVTAESESRVYDGYVLSNSGFTAAGLVEGDELRSAVVEGSLTDVGACPNVIKDAVIVNASGTDVTANYSVTYVNGTLEVTKKPITITADSVTKVYDGAALTKDGYTSTGLADGDVFDSVTVTGSQTRVGESANVPSNADIVRPVEVEGEEIYIDDVLKNYDVTYQNGTLKVTERPLTVTADSAAKVYDGKALTKESYTVEGLAEDDGIQSVTVTGSQTDAGVGDNVPSGAVIVNGVGEDVTDCYAIGYVNGALEVTKKSVKLTAASSVQVNDGTEKTVSGFTVSADGRSISEVEFGASVSASGSGTATGDYPVTFTGVVPGETTDTTGNYVVSETENGKLTITEHAVIQNSIAYNGNVATYTIVINPDGLALNGGNNLTLKDTFTDNQSIDYSSIIRSDDRVTYDYSGYTGTFVIPDGTPVTITYNTRVNGAAGKSVTFGDRAELGVTQYGSFSKWCDSTTSRTSIIAPSGVDIGGTDGTYTVRLFTYPESHMEKGLDGAVFRLLDANHRPIVYRTGARAGEVVTFTTGDDGYVTVTLDDGIVSIHKNAVYYLEMITAPVANEGGKYTYYQKDNTLYRFLITDDPSYSDDYKYFNGDVLKVRCYPESAGINVTKRFSGNYDLTDEQKNQIRFILQKEDLATETWVDVESHTYAEFSYGAMNFSAGRDDGPPLEQAVLYRVIEENCEVAGVDQSSSVILTYQRDNQTVQEYSDEFEVNPDHSTYSFSLLFDNNYVDHKLTLVKINELTGELLSGAKFTVYRAADNAEVKTYVTGLDGTLDIRRDDAGANYAPDTAYYVVETAKPDGYLEPKNPEKIYFYFSENSTGVPAGVPTGSSAVDLTTTFDKINVANHSKTVNVPVVISWSVDGVQEWPAGVGALTVSLYQSVNGGESTPVVRNGNPMTLTLNSAKTFDNTIFADLPARDGDGNDITYSVRQEELADYYTSYRVSGSGWYVIKNEAAVSVTVKKEWYALNGSPATGSGSVAFDLYRTTAEHSSVTSREDLEDILRGEEPVKTGLTLSAANNWENTVTSLQKYNADGALYYYFALEREDSMPQNNEDSYVVVPADGGAPRTLTIKNTQTPITVIIRANDLAKAYGQEDPAFTFDVEVQDDGCTVGVPVLGADGKYTFTVTKGTETKTITFTCFRENGEDAGSYAIELAGEKSQEGYRVRFDDGTLTVTPAYVTVKGTATKVYGDPDPSLVEITGLKEGDTIAYYAYRDIGEQKGSYRITVTGLTKQGNYEITYVNDYLTIEPAPVTVTADNITKSFGQTDPALTVTIEGLKNQDANSVIKYNITREEGSSVGEYPITVTGADAQGNYTVTYRNGVFTIKGQKVTVRAKNLSKTYGNVDPVWEAEVTGLNEGDSLSYSFTREDGEDAGTYVVTPLGETAQGNYEVTYETGLLTINRAPLTITPNNAIKALTDPVTEDPQFTVSFEGLADRDKDIDPSAVYNEGVWTYTYTREGSSDPEFAFTLRRTAGETAGPYIIAATAFGERPRNYNITYRTGIFTILTTYNVVLNQQTRDLVDYTQNPEYTYIAELDLSSIGIERYDAGGFENSRMSFTLPANGSGSKTLPVPSGAKLTVTQDMTNPDYTTSITLDTHDVAGTSVVISAVNKAASIVVTHTRISLPVQARAARRQTESGTADETGAVAVEPLAYLGILWDPIEHEPTPQSATGDGGFINALDAQGVYNLPEDMYYVPDHASVYRGGTLVAQNVSAIHYHADSGSWQYIAEGVGLTSFEEGEELVLFYKPKYICHVQADGQPFYTLNGALAHIDEIAPVSADPETGAVTKLPAGVIEMLVTNYIMPATDALSIPANYSITLTTAGKDTATIVRKASFSADHMIRNSGTLVLDKIILDGNKSSVQADKSMLLNDGTLTVRGEATLQNAYGSNGGALYANSGSVMIEAGAVFTGNEAVNGGAIYCLDGSLALVTDDVTKNRATYGGAVYVAGGTIEIASSITGNEAVNGGAIYTGGGEVTIGGAVSGTATAGGAVFMTGGTVNVSGGTVSGSTAENGGAFYMEGGTVNISDNSDTGAASTISGNSATNSGGMLYATGGDVNILSGTISNNTAGNGNGGAICYTGPGTVTVSGGSISGNKAENGLGGAIYQASGTVNLTRLTEKTTGADGKETETELSHAVLNGGNTAMNGAAIYVEAGIANFDGCSITGNLPTVGGAVGVDAAAKLYFSRNTIIKDNTRSNKQYNIYLDEDSDQIINVPSDGLGSSADVRVYVADVVRPMCGEVCCSFGSYVGTSNLGKFKDDRGVYNVYSSGNRLYWGKSITFRVRYLATGFPTTINSGTQLVGDTTYYPKKTEYSIYELVTTLQNEYYNTKIDSQVYSYTFANGFSEFANQIMSIGWDSTNRRWVLRQHDGNTSNETKIAIFYGDAAFISITNNTGHDLTINPLTVMGKTAVDDAYGYTTAINNVTQNDLLAVTQEHLTIPADASVRLLFPGAKNAAWSMQGTFDGVEEGETISYTLNKPGGGTEQSLPHQSGAFALSGTTLNESGAIYEILFGAAKPICKVMHNGVEHPFETLTLAKNYIVTNTLTTATIEMLQDYQQPKTDVLEIPEGYNITLTTAKSQAESEAVGETYYYVGENPSRATISRSSGDMSAAVRADINASSLITWDDEETGAHATTSLTVHHMIFDGKALGQGGEGGAIKTANVKVYVHHCGFKGYNADFGGALYTKWGQLKVEDCDFNKCQARGGVDKTGGGGIWTTAQKLTVDNCTFTDCSCLESPAQGGAIFHNIRKKDSVVHPGSAQKPADNQKFPDGFSNKSETHISNCVFHDCVAKLGSGGTIESDAKIVTIEYCEFYDSEARKANGANGGAINIYTNDNSPQSDSSLTVRGCYFNHCGAYSSSGSKGSNGGAIRTICKNVSLIDSVFINTYADNRGGVLSMSTAGTSLLIQGCTIDNSSADTESGAIYANATNVTITDSTFNNCTAPSYGCVYHNATGYLQVNNSSFENCRSNVSEGGALYTLTKTLSIIGKYGGKSLTFPVTGFTTTYSAKDFTFKNCGASKDGGAVYNNNSGTSQTLTDCVFDGCSSGMSGGGAFLAASKLTVSGTTVQNCEAVNNGGGLYISPTSATATATFADCDFDNNRVTASGSMGGALFINQGTVSMTGGTVSNNTAANGGGIYNKGTLTISKGTGENGGTITNCVARTSGGGIYNITNPLTLDGATISNCYAVTSGGGIFEESGNLNPYGIITHCFAKQGGGLYSQGGVITINDSSKSMEISDCHATTVNLDDDGKPTATMEYTSDNQGGGVYRKVGGSAWDFNLSTATIKGCTAYDGGGLYYTASNSGSACTLTFNAGKFIGNKAENNGGAIYKHWGVINMNGGVIGGSDEDANRAKLGAAIFVHDGQKITLGGGRITHNVASVGGAVAVGGSNTNTQLLFQGAPVIRNNTNASGEKCNVYLNYDTNGIIRTTSTGLSSGAYIGVYVNDEFFAKHGDYDKPFGTFGKEDNLSSFFNDRIYAGGLKGSSSNQIIWGKFVCKITDGSGNLLYTESTCEAPAVYMTLENDGSANTTSAFGTVSYATPELYNEEGRYSGAYQIQMLIGDYSAVSQSKIANGPKDITLTTASRTPDECGFRYTGDADQAVILRGATYSSMIDTTNMSRMVIENITIDGGSGSGFKSNYHGGILFITNGTQVYLNENATLCNSELTSTTKGIGTNGGGIRMENSAANHLYINGGEIRNCKASVNISNSGYGGGISAKTGIITMNSGLITECYAVSGGGAVVVEQEMYMNGGTITGNDAGKYGGGIELKGKIYFTGNPVVNGNVLIDNSESIPCNLQLMNNDNVSINANGLGPFAEIRVYTDSAEKANNHLIYTNHGEDGDPFGTWTDNANLHCFINDRNVNLRGMKTINDSLIYWRTNPVLTVGKIVNSDWSRDKDVEFDFTVTLIGQETFSGIFEDMTFINGTSTFKLKAGQARTASGFPFDFIHNGINYTVTEQLPEGQTAYTTQVKHNDGDLVGGTTVTGHFGENMSDDPIYSSSVSSVEFTNTRTTDDLKVSKTVTERIAGDDTMPFTFTVTLEDDTITKDYGAKMYMSDTDKDGTDTTVSFVNGVGSFHLVHEQSLKIQGLPTELGFTVKEDLTEAQAANFRTYVTEDAGEEALKSSSSGKIGEILLIAFRNNRYGLVCKIVNDTVERTQLYFRENNNPDVDAVPAIFDELEKAFEAISGRIEFFTLDGASADVKLRIEMVKPQYTMTREAFLAKDEVTDVLRSVTLGTAQKTDPLYPYPTDADMPALVKRGFNGDSMFLDKGNLTIDNITLDGNGENYTAGNGGIVEVNGTQTLTVTDRATLRNSVSSGNGGAIWIGEHSGLLMNGTIENCQANEGGGVYADNGFGSVMADYIGMTIGGTISDCEALNGGAFYAGSATIPADIPDVVPLILNGSAQLTGNKANVTLDVENSGHGGAIYCAAKMEIMSDDVSISGNAAGRDGGGVYLDAGSELAMSAGSMTDNTAGENGGAVYVENDSFTMSGGAISGNTAANGDGGAVYLDAGSDFVLSGGEISDNAATNGNGGAVYDQANSFTMSAGSMTGNTAGKSGGAVYVESEHSFTMSGGGISGNSSPEGAVSAGSDAVLSFSGNASVSGNTNGDAQNTVIMNVYLGYHSNTVIHASDLTGSAPIGVYVTDGVDNAIYYNHGIANRPFGTGSGENLSKFINDRDNSLTGVQGADGLVMWPGKDLTIQVYQNKANAEGKKTTPVGGAQFSLANDDFTVWSGASDPSAGLLTIPWGTTEVENGNRATFTRQSEGSVAAVTYVLTQQEANSDTVRPAGTWRVTVGIDNTVTWEVLPPKDGEGNDVTDVNRTLDVDAESYPEPAYLGEVFLLYNDVKPKITFDPNGGMLSGRDDTNSRAEIVPFTTTEVSKTYAVAENNPTRENAVFRVWSTVKNPVEGDGHKEYKQGDEIHFYRHTDDNDDLTLYALWTTVVCKITDRDDNLLYVNGSPAVYMTLKAGFDSFNDDSFTLKDGTTKATPRKIKMLVGEYEMTQTVELARGKIAEFMTAPATDTDGYKGPEDTCVITRVSSFDSGSMIVNNYTLAIRNIILDGAVEDSSGDPKPVDGDGGIVTVRGNASHLTLAQDATLRNSWASGNGGAIYAYGNTIVTVSEGSHIINCQAANGGAIYADDVVEVGDSVSGTVNITGGEISGNKAEGEDEEDSNGGAIYATGEVNLSGGDLKQNTAKRYGGGLYLSEDAELSMTGGGVSENRAKDGGGVYSDGKVDIGSADAFIGGNTATQGGGGVYVSADGSLALSAGFVGSQDSPNTADYGGGVYLAGDAELTGGSISHNGSQSTEGGGLYLATKSDITLNGTELSHNRAKNGGAVYAAKPAAGAAGTLTFAKGAITNNSASDNGGGVYVSPELLFRMTGGMLGSGNTADFGGGVYVGGAYELSGGTLSTNTAKNGGGAYVGSGGSMTLSGGTVNGNIAQKSGTSVTTGNGAAIYVEGDNLDSHGVLRIASGSISGNKAGTFGGAVYLQGHGHLHVSGGIISANAASNANGGAINVDGMNARIYLSGSPTIFNNPGSAATTVQKNLVLSEAQTTIINTEESGLTEKTTKGINGTVGVYVIDKDSENHDVYTEHGVYDKPFGTFGGDGDENRFNARHLVNDRNLALYGVAKADDDNSIYWLDVVCKVTNASNVMLYQLVNVDDSGINVYVPAVYTILEDGFKAVSGSLYRKSGSRFATANTGAVKVKMLKDYTLDEDELITYKKARNITLTTAETAISTTMWNNGDNYVFVPSDGERTNATLTRSQSDGPMFTVNTPKNVFNVSNLIIDGGSNEMMTKPDVDGGAFHITAVSTSTFSNVTLKDLNATGKGGAVYLKSGKLTLEKETSITGSAAANGGALYAASGTTVAMIGGTIDRNTTEGDGAGIYLDGARLELSGNLNFGGQSTDENGDILYHAGGNWKNDRDDSSEATNGTVAYKQSRQDIYVVNYTGNPANNIVLTGNIGFNGDTFNEDNAGSIWVWCETADEKPYHHRDMDQFAVVKDGADVSTESYAVFRNARDDVAADNGRTITCYLRGVVGKKAGWVYWGPSITGYRRVILRKVNGAYQPLENAVFRLERDNNVVVLDVDGIEVEMKDLKSDENGIIWIGELPYGDYMLVETNAPDGYRPASFALHIGEDGVEFD